MDLKLNGKTALVTGGTAGIGLAIARQLSAEGVNIVLPGRSADKLEAAADLIRSNGAEVLTVLCDPATEEGAQALLAAAPRVDILVNNLGIYEMKAFADISDEDWRRFFETNVLGGARLAQRYFPGMLERDWGRVIFIASESALVIPSEMIHYGMTKTAQLSIARGMAELTKGTGVTVNSVLPGPTRSENVGDFIRSVVSNPDASPAEQEKEFFRSLRPLSLIQRMIEPEEVASLVAYLCSPLAAATSGAVLRADGGIIPSAA